MKTSPALCVQLSQVTCEDVPKQSLARDGLIYTRPVHFMPLDTFTFTF